MLAEQHRVQLVGSIGPVKAAANSATEGWGCSMKPPTIRAISVVYCVVASVGLGILGRDAGDAGDRPRRVRIEEDVLAVGKGHEDLGVAKPEAEAMLLQLEILDDPLAQHAQHLRRHRHLEAGDQLGRDAGAPDPIAALQHQRAQPVLGEIAGSDQPIVAGADDHRVVPLAAHRRFLPARIFPPPLGKESLGAEHGHRHDKKADHDQPQRRHGLRTDAEGAGEKARSSIE